MTTHKEVKEVKEAKESKPKYLVISLPSHEEAANHALAAAAKEGYSTVVDIYVIQTPSGSGTAFALLEQ